MDQPKTLDRKRIAFVTAAIVAALSCLLFLSGALDGVEILTADWRRIALSRSRIPQHVVHVDITQECINRMLQDQKYTWPWPRQIYGIFLNYLKQQGAKVVVFDIIFSEVSQFQVADDQAFAGAISNFGKVVFAASFAPAEKEQAKPVKTKRLPKRFALTVQRQVQNQVIKEFPVLQSYPAPEYRPVVQAIGNVHYTPDQDGTVRRRAPLFRHQGQIYPDLGFATLLQWLDHPSIILQRRRILLRNNRKQYSIPIDRQGNFLLYFYGRFNQVFNRNNKNWVTAYDLVMALSQPEKQQAVKKNMFKDKIVMVGTSAPGLLDLRSNPFHRTDPGSYIYSTLIENILNQDYLKEWGSPWLVLPLILLFALVTAWIGVRFSVIQGAVYSFALLLGYALLSILAFTMFDALLALAAVEFSIVASFLAASVSNHFLESRQKRFIQGAFSQMLAPAVLDKLLADPSSLGQGGEEKTLTIFFSDLAGFTTLSEQLGSPSRLVDILNRYLSAMSDIILLDYEGYVDKYEGDAIMAFWNAPLDDPEHAVKACLAALANQQRLAQLQDEFRELGLPSELQVRIGVNTGKAVVGMIGSMRKLNYTVIGDEVNLASRLEGANKMYGTRIMISDSTRRAAGERILSRPLDLIRVKGRTEPTKVYEVLAAAENARPETMQLAEQTERAFSLYLERRFTDAAEAYAALDKLRPDSGVTKVFLERCEFFCKNPPQTDWDGVYTMQTK